MLSQRPYSTFVCLWLVIRRRAVRLEQDSYGVLLSLFSRLSCLPLPPSVLSRIMHGRRHDAWKLVTVRPVDHRPQLQQDVSSLSFNRQLFVLTETRE